MPFRKRPDWKPRCQNGKAERKHVQEAASHRCKNDAIATPFECFASGNGFSRNFPVFAPTLLFASGPKWRPAARFLGGAPTPLGTCNCPAGE